MVAAYQSQEYATRNKAVRFGIEREGIVEHGYLPHAFETQQRSDVFSSDHLRVKGSRKAGDAHVVDGICLCDHAQIVIEFLISGCSFVPRRIAAHQMSL